MTETFYKRGRELAKTKENGLGFWIYVSMVANALKEIKTEQEKQAFYQGLSGILNTEGQ